MGLFNKKDAAVHQEKTSEATTPEIQSARQSVGDAEIQHNDHAVSDRNEPAARTTFIAVCLGVIASMGGMVFGYESGQISGMERTILCNGSTKPPQVSLMTRILNEDLGKIWHSALLAKEQ